MVIAARRRNAALIGFLALLAGVYVVALAIAGQLEQLGPRGTAVAVGLTVDLAVVVPGAFYLLVVRPRRLPILWLVPVVVLSALAASRILPPGDRQALRVLEILAGPLELGLLAWIGWRTARAVRRARGDAAADPYEVLRRVARDVTGSDRLAAVLASEIAVLRYGLGSWRSRAHAPDGAKAFTHHVRSGHGGIVFGLLILTAGEGIAVHLLLGRWSAVAAWAVTLATAYGALWLVADYRATVLRPILVGEGRIVFRAGLRWTLAAPLAQVVDVGTAKPDVGKASAKLTLLATPTRWVTLAEPAVAEGPYGFRRRVRAIGLQPDEAEAFDRAVAAERGG